jgi:NAD(P)-dependent dehydrogenase (short-subunit alcohol dehydrogenase family)
MLTRRYDARQAYAQSKLALVMFTFDLAAVLQGTGVTANAIHPATLMNTNMVAEAGLQPHGTVEEHALRNRPPRRRRSACISSARCLAAIGRPGTVTFPEDLLAKTSTP